MRCPPTKGDKSRWQKQKHPAVHFEQPDAFIVQLPFQFSDAHITILLNTFLF